MIFQDLKLVNTLIEVESGGDDQAIGDNGQAFGCLQIWQSYMDDAVPGRKAKECLGNRSLSLFALAAYMKRYANAKRLGHEPTREDYARIHNGGPNGWKNPKTLPYWKKVEALLAK